MEPPQLHITIPNAAIPCLPNANSITPQADTLELGARLLGELHRVPILLRCAATHACFFLLGEDSWMHCDVQVTASTSRNLGISTDCFFFSPARWSGGGTARGLAVCRARAAGLHTAAVRVVCSTAIVRSLSFIADAMLFSPGHVTLEAHEKDYDICSEDDPACEYYVNLGVAFPRRSLCSTVKIINNSPLTYKYYWSVRPWGERRRDFQLLPASECQDDALCAGAKHDIQQDGEPRSGEMEEAHRAVRVSTASGCLRARAESAVRVHVPDAGALLRTRRAVLVLVLENVPEESFPSNYDPKIVKTNKIEEKCIPGVSPKWSRKVCEVVCAQLEVWWEVVPVRFLLDPPLIQLPYSRRVKSVAVSLRSTQLHGASPARAAWRQLSPAPA
ncbi:uncharacterized protein LOC123872624, partial [Maniola jurtina]|uniref:uncharacterized protein LOC123872624 n=1 Tax=Maniola jurtina TaxID=191418 RepID=UPI001E687A63